MVNMHFSLQRESLHRKDAHKLSQWKCSTDARVMLVFNGLPSIGAAPYYLPIGEISTTDHEALIFLGCYQQRPTFALRCDQDTYGGKPVAWGDVRRCTHLLDGETLHIAMQAKALAHWHQFHQFCSNCGVKTQMQDAGYRRQCPACQTDHFPRCDPAVIVGVEFEDMLLLGRQNGWPEKRYSLVAGFAEPGESVEQAVVREVMEETGITVTSVEYLHSQPWPYPASLMLAFSAIAEQGKIELHDKELENARWVSRQALQEALRDGSIILSPRASIAYQIIRRWYDRNGASLDELTRDAWF